MSADINVPRWALDVMAESHLGDIVGLSVRNPVTGAVSTFVAEVPEQRRGTHDDDPEPAHDHTAAEGDQCPACAAKAAALRARIGGAA